VPDAPRRRPAPHVGVVLRTEQLSASFVRVVVGGLSTFEPSPHADSYVKVVMLPPGVDRPTDAEGRLDLDAVRAALPADDPPRLRAYTVRSYDADRREVALDFVVHGDEGVAAPWAAQAQPGDPVALSGPGGAWSPDPAAASHLLIGDASALPAVAVALEHLPADAVGHALLEVPDADDELPLATPAGVEVRYVHTRHGAPGAALVDAVLALPPVPAPTSAFLHGEAGMVRELRRHLRVDRGIPRDALSVSGYWRLGVTDEGWRAGKRAWLEDIEAAEASAGLG
jgi:NADPH-dependent ferric siderophore reductase